MAFELALETFASSIGIYAYGEAKELAAAFPGAPVSETRDGYAVRVAGYAATEEEKALAAFEEERARLERKGLL